MYLCCVVVALVVVVMLADVRCGNGRGTRAMAEDEEVRDIKGGGISLNVLEVQ